MISFVSKFISWIKDLFTMILALPSTVAHLTVMVGDCFDFLPNNLGTIVSGALLSAVLIGIVVFIVKLVVSLL